MTNTENVLTIMEQLSPNIKISNTTETLSKFISIADIIVENTEVETKNKDLAVALLSLDMVTIPETSSIRSTSIGDVTISYSGKGTTKWKSMYDSLVDGVYIGDLSMLYRGI